MAYPGKWQARNELGCPKYMSAVQIGNLVEEQGAIDSDFPQTFDPPIDAIYTSYLADDRGEWGLAKWYKIIYKDGDGNSHTLWRMWDAEVIPVTMTEITSIQILVDQLGSTSAWYGRSGTVGLRKD